MIPESNIFKLSPLQCVGIMVRRYASKWILIIGLLLSISVIIGFIYDLRIILVILMIVCLGCPVLLTLLYYMYGLHGESYLNIVDHKISVEDDNFRIFVGVREDNDADCEPNTDLVENPASCGDLKFKIFDFKLTDIGRYTVGKDYVIFPFVGEKKGFLYIPINAFDNEEAFLVFVKRLSGTFDAK